MRVRCNRDGPSLDHPGAVPQRTSSAGGQQETQARGHPTTASAHVQTSPPPAALSRLSRAGYKVAGSIRAETLFVSGYTGESPAWNDYIRAAPLVRGLTHKRTRKCAATGHLRASSLICRARCGVGFPDAASCGDEEKDARSCPNEKETAPRPANYQGNLRGMAEGTRKSSEHADSS
jgi:hypothetical protein